MEFDKIIQVPAIFGRGADLRNLVAVSAGYLTDIIWRSTGAIWLPRPSETRHVCYFLKLSFSHERSIASRRIIYGWS